MADLYRRKFPKLPAKFAEFWEKAISEIIGDVCELSFSMALTEEEFSKSIKKAEKNDSDLLAVLPVAYAPSAIAKKLVKCRTLFALISSSSDQELPYSMDGNHLLANQGMHGVIDLANVLWRSGISFPLICGHPNQESFRRKLIQLVKCARAAKVFKSGKAGKIGDSFEGMLDLSFDEKNKSRSLGFETIKVSPSSIVEKAKSATSREIQKFIKSLNSTFQVSKDFTEDELDASARMSIAIQSAVKEDGLDAIAMNFVALVEKDAPTMPFLGASILLSQGIGYAGESDVLSAMLSASLAKISPQATFTELYSPDYGRNELLLSHMGECNFSMAGPGSVLLKPKPFLWGKCLRPAVPVFQMEEGKAIMASISQTPDEESFQILCFECEIVKAPDHPNLTVPYTRIRTSGEVPDFLKEYSRKGGTHHLALAKGISVDDINTMTELLGIEFKTIKS